MRALEDCSNAWVMLRDKRACGCALMTRCWNACVMSVRDNLHLPVKKEHLKKFANMPQQNQDDEVRT